MKPVQVLLLITGMTVLPCSAVLADTTTTSVPAAVATPAPAANLTKKNEMIKQKHEEIKKQREEIIKRHQEQLKQHEDIRKNQQELKKIHDEVAELRARRMQQMGNAQQ